MTERIYSISTNKTTTFVRQFFTCLFLLVIIVRLWFDISELHKFRPFSLLLPATFIFITYYRTKITWILAMTLFLYGIYYYFFRRVWVAYPGAFEFTLPINELLYRDKYGLSTGHPVQFYLRSFPLAFYFVSTIVFLLNPIRKQYWTNYRQTKTAATLVLPIVWLDIETNSVSRKLSSRPGVCPSFAAESPPFSGDVSDWFCE